MKYRTIAAIAFIWSAAFIQSTLFENIRLFNVKPNLLIVLMVIVALLRSTHESAIMGLCFGLCMDILMGKAMGWYALLFFLMSVPISNINDKLYRDKFLVLLSFTFLSTVLIETSFFLIFFLFKDYSRLPYAFSTIILPEAVINSILILPLFRPIQGVYTILDKVDRRRNRISS